MHFEHKQPESKRWLLPGFIITSLLLFLGSAELSSCTILNEVDNSIFLFCQWFTYPLTIRMALFLSLFGTGIFLIPAYIIIVHFLIKLNYQKYATMVVSIVLTSLLAGWILKIIFHRHRPTFPLVGGAGWYSFPSGHALGIFTFSGICLFLLWKAKFNITFKRLLSVLFICFGLAVALSRIFLHVHYATDILGSLFFSGFWITFVYLIFRTFYGVELHNKKQNEEKINGILRENK